jgi:hypothetical protein
MAAMTHQVGPVAFVPAGDDVTSTWPVNQPAFGGYAKMKGTSMVRADHQLDFEQDSRM